MLHLHISNILDFIFFFINSGLEIILLQKIQVQARLQNMKIFVILASIFGISVC